MRCPCHYQDYDRSMSPLSLVGIVGPRRKEVGRERLYCHHVVAHALYVALSLQRYLAHKKTPTPLGPPEDQRHSPTVGSWGGAFFYERGSPAGPRAVTPRTPAHLGGTLLLFINPPEPDLALKPSSPSSVLGGSGKVLPCIDSNKAPSARCKHERCPQRRLGLIEQDG